MTYRHPLDADAIAADAYYDRPEVGTREGKTCGRFEEPDEDAPRGWRPRPCDGVMVLEEPENCACHINPPCAECEGLGFVCDTCGERTDP
jgi:hypothetical protein